MKQIINAYALAYRFIPELIGIYNEGRAPLEDLSNTDLWYSILKENDTDILLDWSCVKAEYQEVSDELCYVFYSFPEPQFSPEAKYAIAVIHSKGDSRKAIYYTLEYSTMHNSNGDITYEGWVLGGMDMEMHHNYGSFEKAPTKENFIDTVLNMSKPKPKNNSTTNKQSNSSCIGRIITIVVVVLVIVALLWYFLH